ncbi:helix-turn-helix domain-containing protein [Streptomyces glaucus]|uniref:HTH cro/C1-type domain-containing protein n=1 Tax=Streptomyces glaucus TaxID=284029 RepID=A0ABN3J592_9ACTN
MTPPALSPERARLAAALRELKTRTGLSLAGLAAKTPYSKSSWERYLNGKTLPPRQAVRDLCRLAGEAEGRCLALWEIAESQWSGRATEGTPAGPDTPPRRPDAAAPAEPGPARAGPAGHRGVAAVAVLASVCAVAVGGVAVALLTLPHRDGARSAPPPSSSVTGPLCRGAACEGGNPMHMRCGVGPSTLASYRTATGARLELRHSRACGTGWARMWNTRIGDRLTVTAGGPTRSAQVKNRLDTEEFVFTPMTVARPGAVVRACFRPAADGGRECFDGRVR